MKTETMLISGDVRVDLPNGVYYVTNVGKMTTLTITTASTDTPSVPYHQLPATKLDICFALCVIVLWTTILASSRRTD